MSYLLDTNVVSELIKPRPNAGLVRWIGEVEERETFLSVITIAELRRGIELLSEGSRRERLEQWLGEVLLPRFQRRVLGITPMIAGRWGQVMARSERQGRRMGVMDAFLAATAEVEQSVLVTHDASDFGGFEGDLLNPWS